MYSLTIRVRVMLP